MLAISMLAGERLVPNPTVTTVEVFAQSAVDVTLRIGAKRILADPFGLGLMLFPSDPFSIYDRPIENIRFNVEDRMRAARENAGADARDGGRRYEQNTMIALRQAAMALEDERAWEVAMKRWR